LLPQAVRPRPTPNPLSPRQSAHSAKAAPATQKPEFPIFLSATTDLLMERVRTRDRDFEQDIHREYYAAVNDAYEDYFTRYSGRKLRLAMHEWDFVKDPELYNRLSTVVDAELDIK
jgi:deoxyadenosine/deoxycytidine kinase